MPLLKPMTTTSAIAGSVIAAAVAGLMMTASASAQDGQRGARGERFAERIKDRCENMRERLANIDRDLSADQMQDIIQGRLAQVGEGNLKVGKVTKKDDDTVALEIVTKGGALVSAREFSLKTGLPTNTGANCDQIAERASKAVAARGERGADRRGRGMRGDRPRDGRGPDMAGGMPGRMPGLGLIGDVGPDRDLNLSKDQARTLAEAALIAVGNPRLKVGEVREKDADTYEVDIVASDKTVIFQREIDRHTGRPKRS